MELGRGGRGLARPVWSGLLAAVMVLAVSVSLPKSCSLSSIRGRAADLDWLANRLPRLHTNLFATIPEAEYRQALADLRGRVSGMDDAQYFVTLWQLLARVGDPSTTVSLTGEHPASKSYPVNVKPFPEGIYVTTATQEHPDLIGCRLVSIDGMPVVEAMARTATLVVATASPPRVEAVAAHLLYWPAGLYALGVTRQTDTAAFVFERPDGSQTEMALQAATLQGSGWTSRGPRFLEGGGYALWGEYLPAEKTLYISCSSFRDDPAAGIGSLKVTIDRWPVERVVVDMRNNSGSEVVEGFPLVDWLAGRAELQEPGRLYVLVGQGTAGAALRQAYEIRRRIPAAIFAGGPSGGKPNYYGEVRAEELPYSRLLVRYSTRYFESVPGEDPPYFEPDVVVRQTAADYFAQRDTVWEAVSAHEGK